MNRKNLGLTSDALLYLGPRDLDIILDLEYRAEMDRRMALRTGKPMGPPYTANNVPQRFSTIGGAGCYSAERGPAAFLAGGLENGKGRAC